MVGGTQLDLFGQVETELERRAERARVAAEILRRSTAMPDGAAVVWVAPWNTATGVKKGQAVPGRRCWLCGQIEAGEFQLELNHGLSAGVPGVLDWTECQRQRRQAHQERIAAERQARSLERGDSDAGLDMPRRRR